MKLGFFALSVQFLAVSSAFAGLNDFSHGFRMGQLVKFSVKGLINKSGEGQLLMGNESTTWVKGTGDDKKTMNPWSFSAEKKMYNPLKGAEGTYVWIEYDQSNIYNPMARNTDYNVTAVQKVQPELAPKEECVDPAAKGKYSEGARVGRIVKVSTKGTVNKSYEIIVQVGNAGGVFHEMTIQSENVYNCAINWVKSGKKVKVDYRQRLFTFGITRDTSYDVSRISPAPSLE